MKSLAFLVFLFACPFVHTKAQQVTGIEFHLYTDSLKKGVYNYINVDAEMDNGHWQPLSSKQLQFTASTGSWDGNNLIIDSSYAKDSVVVSAVMKSNRALQKTITIYMKKNLAPEALKTEAELINEMDKNKHKRRG